MLLKVLQRVLPDAHPKVVSNGCEALQARGGPAPGALTLPPARAPRRCCSAAAPGCHGVCSCARKPRMRAGVCSGEGVLRACWKGEAGERGEDGRCVPGCQRAEACGALRMQELDAAAYDLVFMDIHMPVRPSFWRSLEVPQSS